MLLINCQIIYREYTGKKKKIRKNNDFYTRLTNNCGNARWLFTAFHSSIEFNVLFICGGIGLNKRVMFNRNSIFRDLACSHLEFNRIIGNDNDIYIDVTVPLYVNSAFACISWSRLPDCNVPCRAIPHWLHQRRTVGIIKRVSSLRGREI